MSGHKRKKKMKRQLKEYKAKMAGNHGFANLAIDGELTNQFREALAETKNCILGGGCPEDHYCTRCGAHKWADEGDICSTCKQELKQH